MFIQMLNISVIYVYTNVKYICYQCLSMFTQMLNISVINVYQCLYKC